MKGSHTNVNQLAILMAVSTLVALAMVGTARAELVGHWTLDNDTSGLTNLGTDGPTSDLGLMGTNAPLYSATGGFDNGGYATFDGTTTATQSALISTAPDNAAADMAATGGYPLSLSVWFRVPVPTPTGSPRGTIFAMSNTAAGNQYIQMGIGYNETNGDFELNRRNTTFQGEDAVGSKALISDGNWHHAAGVMSTDSTVAIYLDGILQPLDASVPAIATVAFPTTMNSISIGAFRRNNTTIQDAFRGDIDDPRLYNHALSLVEVRQLAGLIPGDFDGDKDVDGTDFVAWQNNFPLASGAALGQGDADGDGDVDGADFVVWQTNFPTAPGPGASTIPEPTALLLGAFGAIGLACVGRHRLIVR
jgi:hypothetical protein